MLRFYGKNGLSYICDKRGEIMNDALKRLIENEKYIINQNERFLADNVKLLDMNFFVKQSIQNSIARHKQFLAKLENGEIDV
jgi:hypothetical protein